MEENKKEFDESIVEENTSGSSSEEEQQEEVSEETCRGRERRIRRVHSRREEEVRAGSGDRVKEEPGKGCGSYR